MSDQNSNNSPENTQQSRSSRTRPVRTNFFCHECERNFQQVLQESEEPTCNYCGSSFCEKLDDPTQQNTSESNNNQPLRVQHQVIQHAPNAQSHVVQLHMDMNALENGGTAAMAQQIMQQIQGLNLPGVDTNNMPSGVSFQGMGQNIMNMINQGLNQQNNNNNSENGTTPRGFLGGIMQMTGPNGQTISANPANFAWGPDGMQNILDRLLSEAGQDQAPAGLDEQTINRISTYELSTRQVNRLKDDNCADCAICMAEFQTGSLVKKLPPCGHVFHCDCIDSWLRVRKTCPICRAEVQVEAKMVKRQATTVLNADNWDQEDKQEEEFEGAPKIADEETLKRRTIIKAKRKKPVDKTGASANPFASNSSSSAFSAGGLFSAAFSKVKADKPVLKPSTSDNNMMFSNSFMKSSTSQQNPEKTTENNNPENNGQTTPPVPNFDDQVKDEKFQKAVTKLNQKFVKSVADFVKGNECVDLQPCFDSYNKHFEKIVDCYATESVLDKLKANGVRKFDKSSEKMDDVESKKSRTEIPFKKPEIAPFKFNAENNEDKTTTAKPTFNFGPTSTSTSSKPFTFGGAGEKQAEPVKSSPFTFGGNNDKKEEPSKTATTPFQFSFAGSSSQSSQPKTQTSEPEKKPEEGQPSDSVPEIEDKQFKEEGVQYEIRCKLYYKYEDQFKERGVGTLFVKKDETDGKASILVRAENHQGTILLNSSLSKGMPQPSKNGAKNILQKE